MSGSSQTLWHGSPYAPKVSPSVYSTEKSKFSGILTLPVLYGIVVVLFFQCMNALLNPLSRSRGDIKWLLVAHTVVTFLFVTAYTAVNLEILSISYVGNREYTGDGDLPSGPLGYEFLSYSKPIGAVSTFTFLLNNWLADGLLLYRCYVIYGMRYWSVLLPFVIYLADFAAGIGFIYYAISNGSCSMWRTAPINIAIPYAISVALNLLITGMIIFRLLLLSRAVQTAINGPFKLSGLYMAVVTVLVESAAIYAVNFLLFIGTWIPSNPAQYFFFPILAQVQVIAPFLIIQRIVNRKSLMGDVVYDSITSLTGGRIGVIPSGDSTSSIDESETAPGEVSVRVSTTVDSLQREKACE